MALACIVLHNLHNSLEDTNSGSWDWDLFFDESTKKRPREELRQLLKKRSSDKVRDTSREAIKVRDSFKAKFWGEKQGNGVNQLNITDRYRATREKLQKTIQLLR